jgi:hypothetical protein
MTGAVAGELGRANGDVRGERLAAAARRGRTTAPARCRPGARIRPGAVIGIADACSLVATPALRLGRDAGHLLVDEADDHRALADRGRAALH